MTLVHRVLPPHPYEDLAAYEKAGGGRGLANARQVEPVALIDEVEAAGLRGRGGAGFPTGVKWRTVAENRASVMRTTVVVNAAEGEPGTFKDRTLLRYNPYEVLEGALIAAKAVGADRVIVATKRRFEDEAPRVRGAIAEMAKAGWLDGIEVDIFQGPDEYLYGEETALLEVLDGRPPFPRIAPPFRRGIDEVVEFKADLTSESGLSAHVEMAGAGGDNLAPPTLVDNVETLANVPRIIARGKDWFRTEGTDQSPGTIVCTVTGAVARAGVGEVIMGTPLRDVIELVGGGCVPGRGVKAVMTGVSNTVITADQLDTPVSYEAFRDIGSWLGSASFIVLDDESDMVAVAAGASRFLAIESCGQCVPCKFDGLELADTLASLGRNNASSRDMALIAKRVDSVADRARCSLATQHQVVVGSILRAFGDEVEAHRTGVAEPVEPLLITELREIDAGGVARWDESHREKQPDWTHGGTWTGAAPADEFIDHRGPEPDIE
jgi:NADH:ubiquinone oxidoreductase subunit F (NADH-binding)